MKIISILPLLLCLLGWVFIILNPEDDSSISEYCRGASLTFFICSIILGLINIFHLKTKKKTWKQY